MQIYTIRDDKLYRIIYTGEASKFSLYLPTVEKMIDSIKISSHEEGEGMIVGR
jgi:hypothetical protein